MINRCAFLVIPPRTPQGVFCRKKRQTVKWGRANRQSIGRQHRYNLWEWVASHAKYLKLEQKSCQVVCLFPHFVSQIPHFPMFSPHWEFAFLPPSSSSNLLKRKKNIYSKRGEIREINSHTFPALVNFCSTSYNPKNTKKCGKVWKAISYFSKSYQKINPNPRIHGFVCPWVPFSVGQKEQITHE